MIRILLVRPKPPAETIGLQHVMICEPLELEYLAGNIDRGKAEVRIVDMILEKRPIEYFVRKYQPDLVGMTGYITHVGVIKEMAAAIKRCSPAIMTVVGGVHAEVMPADFLSPQIDYIICERPIATFRSIIEDFERLNRTKDRVDGVYQKGRKPTRSANFDYLPPDRSAVSQYRSRYYYMFHNPCALIKTSFGCPYDCSFCFCKEITGRKYFARDMDEVIAEIESIPEREIYIVDDDFLFDAKRLERFCDLLEEKSIRKNYLVYGRADFIAGHESLIERLSKNGLRAVIVGIESVREQDLIDYNKKTSHAVNRQAVRILQKYDIELYATMILQPDYGKEDFRELEKQIKEMDITFVNLQPLTPLPGTDIFDYYQDKLIVEREDYAKWDLAHLVLLPPKMSVRAYYYQIIRLYYRIVMRPRSIIKMFRKYRWREIVKMWWGSGFVSRQYLAKMLRGK